MMETVIYVQAVYDFEPEDTNELGFHKGMNLVLVWRTQCIIAV